MFDVECNFHLPANSPLRDVGNALEALRPYAAWLGERDPYLKHWWLGGDSLEEARRYQAFADVPNGHAAAKAVLQAEYKKSHAPVVFLWNGQDDTETGASLVLSVTERVYPSKIELQLGGSALKPRPGLGDYRTVAEFVALLARDTEAECCYVYRQSAYGKRKVFKDRPGVGWMLYLPRVFTQADIPEARALIPVTKGEQQIGTIIVSLTEGVFSAKNDEHVRAAQAIETRLVSNDWLPTWAQMMRP